MHDALFRKHVLAEKQALDLGMWTGGMGVRGGVKQVFRCFEKEEPRLHLKVHEICRAGTNISLELHRVESRLQALDRLAVPVYQELRVVPAQFE